MREFGSVVTFGLRRGADAAKRFTEALQLFACAPSLGSTESLVMPPQLMQPRDLDGAQRAWSAIGDGTVRLSIGLEDVGDLLADLDRGLALAGSP
jgi:cystathionine beta-lyase/cystathionine gamma-synthase